VEKSWQGQAGDDTETGRVSDRRQRGGQSRRNRGKKTNGQNSIERTSSAGARRPFGRRGADSRHRQGAFLDQEQCPSNPENAGTGGLSETVSVDQRLHF